MADKHDDLPALPAATRIHPDAFGRHGYVAGLGYTIDQGREIRQDAYSAGQRAAAVRAAELCEAQMDLAEAAEADKRAHDALKSSDESRQLSRFKHASVVSLYNAAMRNCADAILREFGIDKEQSNG